jgi:flagellin
MTKISLTTNQVSSSIANSLSTNMKNMKNSLEKISSGEKFSNAGENPTSFAIGKSLKIDSNSLETNYINTKQAMSFIQTADVGLDNIKVIMQDMLALSAEAVSDTLSPARQSLQNQITQYSEQIKSIIKNTSFNNISLLDGNIAGESKLNFSPALSSLDFKVEGAFSNNSINNITFGTAFDNQALLGKIPAINIVYNNPNDITYSINIGDKTYTANNNDTASQNIVRLQNTTSADLNDYIEINMVLTTVSNSSDSDLLATQINNALETIIIKQSREVMNFNDIGDIQSGSQIIGSLTNSKLLFESSDFSSKYISNIDVYGIKYPGDDATLSIDIGGDTFSAVITNGSLKNGENLVLNSVKNPSNKLIFQNGDKDLNLASKHDANNFKTALNNALNIKNPQGITFQTGLETSDYIDVTIPNMQLENLFLGQDIDLSSAANAQQSVAIISQALDKIISTQSLLGNTYNRFEHISDQITSNIINIEEVASYFLDTDQGQEFSNKEMYDILTKTSIAMLKEANQVMEQLLKLLD